MTEVAKRKVNGQEDWEICIWERIGAGRDFVVQGSVPRRLTRGPRKGQMTWDGPHQKTVVTSAEIDAEHARYEAETGCCGDCFGTGEVWKSCSIANGVEMKPCGRCQGTGNTPHKE